MNASPESGGYALPLHVEEYGDGHRQIMLLHGFGANSYTWRGWIGGLAKEHRVWSVELKGHGSAPAPPIRANCQIVTAVWMPLRTMSLLAISRATNISTTDVFLVCDGLQMAQFDTGPVAAKMIDFFASRNWAMCLFINKSMDIDLFSSNPELSISLSDLSALPNQTITHRFYPCV